MNPFGMPAGDLPDDLADRGLGADEVFKNFRCEKPVRREYREQGSGQRGGFVVEVRRTRRIPRDAQ